MIDLLNNPIRLAIGDFLNIAIIQNNYIWINMWSVVHLIVGFLLIYLLIKVFKLKRYTLIYLFILLIIYEAIEFQFYTRWFVVYFIAEELVDMIWDMIIGMFGGLIAWFIFNKIKKKK